MRLIKTDNILKKYKYFFVVILFSCSQKKEIINREVKLQEARKGYELLKLNITKQKEIKDTSAVYFNASVRADGKILMISDSIFFVKNPDGTLLPFSSNPQSGK